MRVAIDVQEPDKVMRSVNVRLEYAQKEPYHGV